MLLKLDGDGVVYLQLSRAIRSAVRAGQLAVGARLPSTRDLASDLKVARNTVRAAYDQLANEGLLVSRAGSGCYVARSGSSRAPMPRSAHEAAQSRYAERLRDSAWRTLQGVMNNQHRRLRFNMQGGEPLTDPLLSDAWRKELTRAAAYTSLGYPPHRGLPDLRREVASYLKRRRGIDVEPDDLLIVAGTQQALALAARVLVDEGALVAIEEPGYFGARWAFQAHGADLVPVAVDRHGIDVEQLPATRPALVYVTPAHQFPLGMALAHRRRAELLRYARRHSTWILEDDYDGEVSFDAPQIPPLYGADGADRVVHIGTFSKVLAPSIRLGYLVPPKALRDDFVIAKLLADFGCPAYEQAALAGFLRSGGFTRHLRRVVQSLRKRRDALVEGLREHGRGHFVFDAPRMGMHMVVSLVARSPLDLDQLIREAATVGVGLPSMSPCYLNNRNKPRALLLGYAGLSTSEITMACKLLGGCIDRLERIGRAKASAR
jgi:GntR family transcriptional regulator / MocR family aminotransferase